MLLWLLLAEDPNKVFLHFMILTPLSSTCPTTSSLEKYNAFLANYRIAPNFCGKNFHDFLNSVPNKYFIIKLS